ncbi:T9SS type A sorting domain-containing protein [uncultured Psychroserpens sp.]|uniref:T9SS type A sorting domain-containing protein n=1 Tax=uncultured Psychroserpens sp. TaxID=255436 RepID=UPI0026366BA5|nr:T9SS type A sorting domain-containing protein [uncultured Psychroserpens sp.]
MKKLYFLIVTLVVTSLSFGQDLIITAAFDGPLTGGLPKGVELYVVNDIPDLSIYGIGSANNGQGTDGEEFTFPADNVTAGTYLLVASEATQFANWFGFAPDYNAGSAMGINGDDAVELFENGSVIDTFGTIDCDPNAAMSPCPEWEHTDGWAYRVDGTGPDGSTFVLANWTFSGPNALDGETTNASAATPIPVGTYSPVASTDPTINITGSVGDLEYFFGNGPSNEGSVNVSGLNLTTDITIDAPANFEVSLSSGSGFGAQVTLAQSGGTVSATQVFVRLAAGLGVDIYTDDLTLTSGTASDAVALFGEVLPADPQVTVLGSIDDQNYSLGNGPSDGDSFGVEGLFLTGDITVTAPTDFEVSLTMGSGYSSSVSITPSSGTVATTDVFVRLSASLAEGPYSGDVTISSPGVTDQTLLVSGNVFGAATNAMVLTAVYDGPLPGGNPKGVEVYVIEDIPNLSLFGLGSAGNGGGTDGQEFTFPAVSATAGDFIYVANTDSNTPSGFENFFGFAPDYTTGAMGINGDDAIELFENGQVIDTFGTIDCDPNAAMSPCPEWEHTDGWAYRVDNTGPDGSTFVLANWTFSGPDALDGESDNATAATPVPIGTYMRPLSTERFSTNSFSIYPNPTSTGFVNIISTNNENINVAVFDVLGKQVLNQAVNNNRLNVSTLNTGVYIMKITQNNTSVTKKLVIK